MKKIILIIIIILLFGVKTKTVFLDLPLMGKRIYLDAGHGGVDSGARYKDILEKDINLKLVLKLEEALSKKGATVYLTRKEDNDLADQDSHFRKKSDLGNRAKLISNSDADLFISIHLNSYPSSKWKGAQVFYAKKNSEALASIMQNSLNINRKHSIIKNMYMYDRINIPGILIEAGFLSNPIDRNNLLDSKYQNELVNKITDGLIKYYLQNQFILQF